eukprot:6177195-Pleurochrysis_carterae.AAC.6
MHTQIGDEGQQIEHIFWSSMTPAYVQCLTRPISRYVETEIHSWRKTSRQGSGGGSALSRSTELSALIVPASAESLRQLSSKKNTIAY